MDAATEAADVAMAWSTYLPLLFAVMVAMLLQFLIARGMRKDAKATKHSADGGAAGDAAADGSESLEKEAWCPQLEERPWQDAGELAGCPWSFEGCSDLASALGCIWREPLSRELQDCFENLKASTKDLKIVRAKAGFPRVTRFVAVYQLRSGSLLFGGAPVDHAVGLKLSDQPDRAEGRGVDGARRGLPCLAEFFRIHDGFGKLAQLNHLPVIAVTPTDEFDGSCYYVYPVRSQDPIPGARHLVRFARVDRRCVACVDRRVKATGGVRYVEHTGEVVEDEESPLSFVADTIDNVAGKRPATTQYACSELDDTYGQAQ
eukprot:TRINITY_DN45365_c0_g1_i1.p1 TRINITY_DN45365_c0_g1~~TRINITY_DN45365_c0_g1_i1.p1  ORF type:complete len:338 (-),score=62.74 TRINITY_DN45365_c0_g1_i1:94-1047(-)